MRLSVILFLFFLIQFSLPVSVQGQKGKPFDQLKDDISDKLPPLSVLIDSAIANNANVRFKDLQLTINEYKLKSKSIEWTRNFGLQANTGYGNLYNYSSTTTGSIDPVPSATSRSQAQYNFSAYFSLPFFTFADRKNQIKIAKTEIEQAKSMALMQRDEIKQQTILLYNDLILKQRLFRIKVKNLETAKVNSEMVEKQFLNGIIPLTEYTRMLGDVSRLETDFETSRMEFLSAYMILEVIAGMEFNLIQTTSENYGYN